MNGADDDFSAARSKHSTPVREDRALASPSVYSSDLSERRCLQCNAPLTRITYATGKRETVARFEQRKFCSHACAYTYRRAEHTRSWKGDAAGGIVKRARTRRLYRTLPECEHCHEAPAVDRHHKDSNPGNNDLENIAFLCRRCHMLLDGRLDAFSMNEAAHRPRSHCYNGHEFTPATTYIDPHGTRSCRICARVKTRQRYATQAARKKEAAAAIPPLCPNGHERTPENLITTPDGIVRCLTCYTAANKRKGDRRRQKQPEPCRFCGEVKIVMAFGLCSTCYQREHRRNCARISTKY